MLQRFAFVLVLLYLSVGSPVNAQPGQSDDIYTVSGIEVDVTAATTAAARDLAFVEGQRLAMAALLTRLGIGAVDPAGIGAAELDRLVQGFQVEEERLAPGRYIATLTYVFVPAEVQALVRQEGAAVREPPDNPIVVLPVFRDGPIARLWDAPNPWHEAWLDHRGGGRSVPIIVPFGDLADVVDINAESALAGDRPALAAIARRYGAEGTLVTVAEPSEQGLSVTLLPYGLSDAGPPARLSVPGGDQPGLYSAAVDRVAEQVDQSWFASPAAPAGPENRLAVLVRLNAPTDWYHTRGRLARVASVTDIVVVSLSAREAVVEMAYRGTEAQLRDALSRAGLQLRQGVGATELQALGGGEAP